MIRILWEIKRNKLMNTNKRTKVEKLYNFLINKCIFFNSSLKFSEIKISLIFILFSKVTLAYSKKRFKQIYINTKSLQALL